MPFNLTNPCFSQKDKEEKRNILNNNIIHPENFNYIQNFSGNESKITNNINIKNVNIINCNDSNPFIGDNNNQNLFLLDKFNVNNTILQNNKLNNKKNNYFRHNNFINFSNINENNNYKDKFHDLFFLN